MLLPFPCRCGGVGLVHTSPGGFWDDVMNIRMFKMNRHLVQLTNTLAYFRPRRLKAQEVARLIAEEKVRLGTEEDLRIHGITDQGVLPARIKVDIKRMCLPHYRDPQKEWAPLVRNPVIPPAIPLRSGYYWNGRSGTKPF